VTAAIDLHLGHPLALLRDRRRGLAGVFEREYAAESTVAGDSLLSTLEQMQVVASELQEPNSNLRLVLEPEDWIICAETGSFGLLLHLEGLGPVRGSLLILDFLVGLGVRSAQLTWNGRNEIADGVGVAPSGKGLTRFGRGCITRLNELGVIIDVAHLAPRGVDDVLEISRAPVICSHSNARAIFDHPRNLTDSQIEAIASTGGLVGITSYGAFLDAQPPTVDTMVRHLDHIVELVGHEHVGLGSDFIYYAEDIVVEAQDASPVYAASDAHTFPPEFSRLRDFPAFWDRLRSAGYSDEAVDAIAHRNFRRVFSQVRRGRSDAPVIEALVDWRGRVGSDSRAAEQRKEQNA
jgi:membrane dipeptidase